MENEEIPVDGEISDMSEDDFAEALLVNDEGADDADTDQSDDLETAEADDDQEEIDPDESQEGDTEEPVFDVTVDGQSQQVPLSELTSGYLRQADYTRKTMELADTRRQAEAIQAQYSEKQQQLETELTKWAIQSSQEPDWVALSRRLPPQQFQEAQAQWMQQSRRREDAKQQLAQIRAEHQQSEAQRLFEAVPEWRDQETKAKELTQIVQHAAHYGFSEAELGTVDDHRVFRLLRDAVIGRQAQQSTKVAAQKRVAQASKQAPQRGRAAKGQGNKAAQRKAMDALRQTGSDEAFMQVIMNGG